ncbi:lactosylceramide 1,3-N-acetyl-beta-D-glucosaminyltransferase [Platysternon megacephalum]|uniref:Lactosylceramide 1,3-N-acetyl-beta-D-glucosaminyltransferase n=1 Tax=Platysternon megacephalum TaxID=55544 RepID=A0A4D9E0T9_9SAUR|nr:lactosylceramide 1,3-N-acetyl-beta-D-glucosaminyltransferase [Platysternon megacephalum]
MKHHWGMTRSQRRLPSPGTALGLLARGSGSSSIAGSPDQIRMLPGNCRPLHLTHLVLSQDAPPSAPGVEGRKLAYRKKSLWASLRKSGISGSVHFGHPLT